MPNALTNAGRQSQDDLRQRILAEVGDLWTRPGSAVAESAYHYLLVGSLGVEDCIERALKCAPSDFRRDESEREFLVSLVVGALNRLMEREPLKLL